MITIRKLPSAHRINLTILASAALSIQLAQALPRGGSPVQNAAPALRSRAFAAMPLCFEPNQGQAPGGVQFVAHGNGCSLLLSPDQAILNLCGADSRARANGSPDPGDRGSSTVSSAIRMRLVGANPTAAPTEDKLLPGKSSYFIGSDPHGWRNNIPQFAQVSYRGVYPGIDLVYHGKGRQIEHDFIVGAGASPSSILMAFDTTEALRMQRPSIRITAGGDLSIAASKGELRLLKPVAYQDIQGQRRSVAGRFILKGSNRVGFKVAAYDHTAPLIIDPVLAYSTYFGGSGVDVGMGIALYTDNNDLTWTFITGYTNSLKLPVLGPEQSSIGGSGTNAFVAKFDPNGALVYSTYLGGSGTDYARGIAVDSSGSAYIAGDTTSANFPVENPYQGALSGPGNAFVSKLDPTGTALIYSTYLGGEAWDFAGGIAVDANGEACVIGSTESTKFPVLDGFQSRNNGTFNAFVTKFDSSGTGLVYSTYLGGDGADAGSAIAVDADGDAFVAGSTTSSTGFPTTSNAVSQTKSGDTDAFAGEIDPSGTALLYATYLGGSANSSFARGIGIDGVGNLYVTGYTYASDFPTTNGFQTAISGQADAFVTEIDPVGGAIVYSTFLGGTGYDFGSSIAVTPGGDAYVSGFTGSSNFPVTNNPLQPLSGGSYDAFISRIHYVPVAGTGVITGGITTTTGAALVNSTYFGGSGNDQASGIAIDVNGYAYITGFTFSPNFTTTPGVAQQTWAGSADAFVAKIGLLPPAPVDLQTTFVSQNEIDLAWNNNGDSTTTFNIYQQKGSGSFVLAGTTLDGITTFADQGLVSGVTYTFQVVATSTIGTSATATLTVPTLPALPAAPSDLVGVTLSQTSVELTWTSSSAGQTGFTVMRSTNGGASFVSLPLIPGANTTYKDTGLTANTTYTYEVVATNASGNSAPSNAATVQTFPPAPPAPSGLTAIATSSVEVTLSWLPTSGTETGFEIERRSPGTVFTVLPLTVVPKGATSAVDPSVVPGTSYTYRIIAFNQSGDSRPSNTASCITPPASPTNLTATPTSSSSVVLSWVNPSPNPQGITVLRGVGVLAPVPIKNLNGKLTTYTDTSAIASTFYTYEVIATDKGGNSAPSNSVNVTMPPPPPGTPVNLNAVTASTVQIDLSWTRTGASETGFSIERRTGSESFAQIATVVAGVTLFNDTTCEANTNYIYRVRGYNSGGYSAYTNTASATTLSNAPNNLVATLTPANSVLLTWINNSLTSTVHIHRTGGAGAVDFYISGTQSSYTDSTVQPGMNYTYVVYANNQGGDSTPSNQVGITTP